MNLSPNPSRTIFWWNGLAILLVLVLIVYGKVTGLTAAALVAPPPGSANLYQGFLTHAMQMLCAVPTIVCAFSFGLCQAIHPYHRRNYFLLASALVNGGFWANEILRIHVILMVAGIPKWQTVIGYCLIIALYIWRFRQRLRATPYGLPIASFCLFLLAFAMDSRLLGTHVSDLLEGFPKFLSFCNLALYFWLVARQEVLKV